MKIIAEKTEVQIAQWTEKNVNLTLEGRKLNQVEEFVYLGGKINENGSTVVLLRWLSLESQSQLLSNIVEHRNRDFLGWFLTTNLN